MILMNPSKSFKEIHKEKLKESSDLPEKNESNFKNLIMFLGSKIFIKDPLTYK